jgi:hypothetical protein
MGFLDFVGSGIAITFKVSNMFSGFFSSHINNKVTHESKQPKSKKQRRLHDRPVLRTSCALYRECRLCGCKHENKKKKGSAWGKTYNAYKGCLFDCSYASI